MADDAIEVLLEEGRTFPPPDEFKQSGNLNDPGVWEKADKDPEAFWAEQAQQLDWFKPWDKVLEWDCPWAKWFIGGKLNVSYNCLDRHVKTARKNKAAIIWEGEPGDERVLTYRDVWREVNKFANVLKGLGVRKGDRVALYLGMVPELLIAMHACNRIGAVHSVVFGGFSAESLSDRINDASAKVLVTGDGGYRRGTIIPLKKNADEAVESSPSIEHVVVVRRVGSESDATMKEGRDHWWHELMADAPLWCEPEQMDSEDMLFSLYTSGTTGKPKGIVHTTAGYLLGVYLANKWVFDMKEDDVFWCAADIGWVTGHTHIVYGPMANGVTQVMYEGSPDWPRQGPPVAHGGEVWCHHLPHRAHGHPHLHALGDRVSRRPRPEQPEAPGLGGRAHQPRGLDVVPRAHRPPELPDHGHLVADRDRAPADHSVPGRHHSQAPLRPPSRSRASRRTSSTSRAIRCPWGAAATWC